MSIQIRDPIHGAIFLSSKELELIDHPAFQRLRSIKQLGFADQAFPGATHSRYSHSLGAMAMATRVFDSLFKPGDVDEGFRKRARQTTRLAMLLHDIGHPPLSHTTEMLMPASLTHEDYTAGLIRSSSFGLELARLFSDEGVTPENITDLNLTHAGISYQPVLKQIISSECDADRMDYLQRDSVYCGVNYGRFDVDWLVGNLTPVQIGNALHLGIKSKGMFSFEDFLLSRYHMFASVYLHHTPVIFEKMLKRYFEESDDAFELPSDFEEYIKLDDTDLLMHLKRSKNPWARRVISRQPYSLVADELSEAESQALCEKLKSEKIDFIESQSKSAISKYFDSSGLKLYVQTKAGQVVALEAYTELFERYPKPAQFNRIYVAPEDKTRVHGLS